jgi:hypothetical protein
MIYISILGHGKLATKHPVVSANLLQAVIFKRFCTEPNSATARHTWKTLQCANKPTRDCNRRTGEQQQEQTKHLSFEVYKMTRLDYSNQTAEPLGGLHANCVT